MFTVALEDRYRILLARFSGIHVPEDISELDRAVTETIANEGPLRLLLDYTSVQAVAIPQSFIERRASLPQLLPGAERVMVVPSPQLYELARAYATRQRDFGIKEPHLVLSIWDAYELLHLEQPNFRPIPQARGGF